MPTVVEPFKFEGVRYSPGDTVSSEVAKQLPDGYAVSDAEAKKAAKADDVAADADAE